MSCKSGVGPLKASSGELIVDDTEIAEVLNSYFTSVFTVDDSILPDFDHRVDDSVLINHVEFTVSNITKVMTHMKSSNTADPQGFSNSFFKRLKFSLARPLSALYIVIFFSVERFQMTGDCTMSLLHLKKVFPRKSQTIAQYILHRCLVKYLNV